MHVVAIVAGTNDPSNVEMLSHAFLKGVQRVEGMETEVFRVRDLMIEHFRLEHYLPETDQGKDFVRIERAILESDGVVIATPIWNFSVPPHLKNLIDRLGSCCLDTETRTRGTLNGKPFFFLYTGGAPVAAWKGLMRFTTMHLPESIRYFGGSVAGRHFEGKAILGRGTFGLVMDKRPDALTRVEKKGRRFGECVKKVKETGVLPWKIRAITKLYKLGQRFMAKL